LRLKKSPLTKKVLREAYSTYSEIGLFWSSLILLTSCYIASKEKWLLMKFGSSGAGKTISDKVALNIFAKELNPLYISGRLTPAGMAKELKRAEKDERSKRRIEAFRNAKLIFVEDLSRCTTHYLKLTSLQFLAGLTRTTTLDDLTSDGGTLGGNLGKEPKKCMVAGTPSDWEEISSTSLYNEFIDRRSLTVIALMSPEEWAIREKLALQGVNKSDWQILLEWQDIFRRADVSPYFGPMKKRTFGKDRLELYKKLRGFKKYPENLLIMIDSLAEGHARINGRDEILPEDYEVIHKLFGRFLVLADMKKKELYIVEEVIREAVGMIHVDALVYRLRGRAKREDLPEISLVRRSIYNYVTHSKYLEFTNRGGRRRPVSVRLSKKMVKLLNDWRKEVSEVLK